MQFGESAGSGQVLPRFPANVPAGLTRATARYKRHAWLAFLGLLAFVALYLGLAGWFSWTAFRCVRDLFRGNSSEVFQDLAGGGASLVLAVFLIKALFFVKAGKASDDIEVKPAEQPELFAFLFALADRAGAPRPHRVYVSSRVNAAVFYDLSLLNLIFPSRKNLEIGLGLVNCVSLSELTAVLSHEFGHFAQRSMAVGRWVYVAQQIAGQIVATRDWLDRGLQILSSTDIRVAWVGWALRVMVWSVRSLLDSVFGLVILAQRALGREMEFQADLMAVALTGSDALVHALHRLGAADDAYNEAVSAAVEQLRNDKAVPDLFALQTRMIQHMARILDEPGHGASPQVPQVSPEQFRVFQQELAEPPRMWRTHPPSREREDNAKRVYVPLELDQRPAWALFRDPASLRARVTADLFSGNDTYAKSAKLSPEQALAAVDRRFARRCFAPHYRGTYLERAVMLPYRKLDDCYAGVLMAEQVGAALSGLYPEPLGVDVRDLRLRGEEHASLEALHAGVLEAPGGVIRHRGRVIPRRALAAVIEQVGGELAATRERVQGHDRQCRAVHRSAARAIGQGWEQHLYGLAATLHYAEHAAANLADARGQLANVFRIVTADRHVSSSERQRLLAASGDVHGALVEAYQVGEQIVLPPELLAGVIDDEDSSKGGERARRWLELLPKNFRLPSPSAGNLGDWLQVIDSWVDGTLEALHSLTRASLEALLAAEEQVASMWLGKTPVTAAPPPAQIPARFTTLTPAQERTRQRKLDWWSRFQTADGFFPGLLRFAVAGGFLSVVLGFGSGLAHTKIVVYNGLGTDVQVQVDTARVSLGPFQHSVLELGREGKLRFVTTTTRGELIESLDQSVSGGRFVYNVAAASPLTEWTATYGNASAREPVQLPPQRFLESDADVLFEEPPQSLQLESNGSAKRVVLSGHGDGPPSVLIADTEKKPEAHALILSHARWDDASAPQVLAWLARLAPGAETRDVIAARLQRNPHDLPALRLEQDSATPAEKSAVCARHRALEAAEPRNPDMIYLALRCEPDGPAQDQGFVTAYRQNPAHAYLAYASSRVLWAEGDLKAAYAALESAVRGVPALAAPGRLDQARLLRLMRRWVPSEHADWMQVSPELEGLVVLEQGRHDDQALTGPGKAYSLLARGELDEAVAAAAQGSSEVAARVARLAGASEGASAQLVSAALGLDPAQGVDYRTLWPSIALAAREHTPAERLREQARAIAPDDAGPLLELLDKHQLDDPAHCARVISQLPIDRRQAALVMAAVLLGKAAPEAVTAELNAMLFGPERPYFH